MRNPRSVRSARVSVPSWLRSPRVPAGCLAVLLLGSEARHVAAQSAGTGAEVGWESGAQLPGVRGGGGLPPLISGFDAFTIALGQFEGDLGLLGTEGSKLLKSSAATDPEGVYDTQGLKLPASGVVSMHASQGFDPRLGTLELWVRTGGAVDRRRTLFSLQGTQSLDGDRYNDLVLGQGNDDSPSWSLVRFGTASGPSSTAMARFRTYMPRGLSAGDVDGDGKADLVVSQNQADAVHVFKGPLRAGFSYETPTAPERIIAVPEPQGHALVDLDADGDLDLLVSSFATTSQPIMGFENDGQGLFTPLEFGFFGITGFAEGMAVADVNRDGVPDVLFGSLDTTLPSVLFLGEIVGGKYAIGFLDPALYSIRSNGTLGASIADVNGDGWPDAVLARTFSNEVAVHLNRGDGSFQPFPEVTISVPRPFTVTASKDMNNDGHLDVAVASWKEGPFITPTSNIFLGPDFSRSLVFDVESAVSFTLGDLDGDGLSDVVWRSSSGNVSNLSFLDIRGGVKKSVLLPTPPTTPGTAGPGVGIYAGIAGGTSPYSTMVENSNSFELYLEGETLVFAVTDRRNVRHSVSVPFPDDGPSLDGFRHVQAEWNTPAGWLSLAVSPSASGSSAYQAPGSIPITGVSPIFRLGTDPENQQACGNCTFDDVRLSNVLRSTLP